VNAELARKVEELGRAKSDLQNLFSSSDVIALFLDRERRVARFTPAAQAFFRLIEADVGRPFADLAPRFADQDLGADAVEVLRKLRPSEKQVETIDRHAWYVQRILPYRTLEDVVAGVVITLADITNIKHAEADLRRLATALLDSNDAVTVLDLDGRILEWNRGAERLYGYSADEAKQINYETLAPEENRPQVRGRLAAIKRGEKVESLEVPRRSKDGRVLDVWLTITKLVDDRGRPVAVATTERDITDRRRAEKNLKAALKRLEVADRKNEFLALLSHELRNPLAPIRSAIYILDHAAPGGEQARRAQAVIDRQVTHLTRLIDDLLDITRINTGKIQLQHELLELNEIAQRTVEDHRGAFVQKAITLEIRAASQPVWLDGDPARLSQVISNLLQNAAKFTPARWQDLCVRGVEFGPETGDRSRAGLGPGNRAGTVGTSVRAIDASRHEPRSWQGWSRPGARSRQGSGRDARRFGLRGERRARRGCNVHGDAASHGCTSEPNSSPPHRRQGACLPGARH
jgi:two-component system CheB/CheR fusion protein